MRASSFLAYWWNRSLHSQKIANILRHSDIILSSACLFTFIWLVSIPLGKVFVPSAFHQRDRKFGRKWRDHWVAQVHAVIASAWSLYNLYALGDAVLGSSEGRLFGYSPALARQAAFTVGYFLWDLWVCIFSFSNYGVTFLVHAIICLSSFALGLTPIMLGYAPIFLMYEGSTVFLNAHWLLEKMLAPKWLLLLNDLLLVISFFGIRLVWGGWWSMRIVADLYWQSEHIPKLASLVVGLAVVSMSVLNNFWFVKIVLSVHRALLKKSNKL